MSTREMPDAYRPPRPVAMAAKIRGAASIVAQLAVESPRDSTQALTLAAIARQLAAMSGSEAAA